MTSKYEVGFAKPPKGSQFKKGQSGNPKGRPKGKKNKSLAEIIEKELSVKLDLRDGDSITKKEAIVRKGVNNFVKTDDVSKSAKALDLILKLEGKNQNELLANDFLDRMISEKYINLKDVEDFARKRQDPKFNIPKTIYKINNRSLIDNVTAWEGVKMVKYLSVIYEFMNSIKTFERFIAIAEREIKFWKWVGDLFMDFDCDDPKMYNLALSTRYYDKPSEEILNTLHLICNAKKNNMEFWILKEREELMELPYYEKNEKDYFDKDGDRVDYKDVNGISKEDLEEAERQMEEEYYKFCNIKYDGKIINLVDIFEDGRHDRLNEWIDSYKVPVKTSKEFFKEFMRKKPWQKR